MRGPGALSKHCSHLLLPELARDQLAEIIIVDRERQISAVAVNRRALNDTGRFALTQV